MQNASNLNFSKECQKTLKIWSTPSVDTPNVLIIQPEYGGVNCTEFTEELAMAHYTKSGIRRSYNKCVVSAIYPADGADGEYQVLFDSPRIVAAHHNHFIGTFCIDLSGCLGLTNTPYFRKLINYINKHKSHIAFIFTVKTKDKNFALELYHSLRKHIRITKIEIGFADKNTYVDQAIELLGENNIAIDDNAMRSIRECVGILIEKPYFAGVDSITRLVEDVECELQIEEESSLTKARLERLKNRLIDEDKGANNARKIGFCG